MNTRKRIQRLTIEEMIINNIIALHGVSRKQAWRLHKEKRLVSELEAINIFNQ